MNESTARGIVALLIAPIAAASLTGCGDAGDAGNAVTTDFRSQLQDSSSVYIDNTLEEIQRSGDAMALAGQLFEAQCASCHGADGVGKKGITNLTLGLFNYGASPESIRQTIRDGRLSEMPGVGREYGELELGQIVAFLETLGTDAALSDYEARGRNFYNETCAACHGADGRGQPAVGAPDLTDDYWQHGDSMMNVRLVITRGALSECPAQGAILTPVQIDLLTAYVLALKSN